jgi:hypothetical protein
LVILGLHGATYRPDVYEMPRQLMDFKATKTLGKHFGLSVKVRDIFNAPVRRAYKFSAGETNNMYNGFLVDYDKYTWGRIFELAVSYKL